MESLISKTWSKLYRYRSFDNAEEKPVVFHNPHFWFIVFLIITITFIYSWNIALSKQWDWFWHLGLFEFSYRIHGLLFAIPLIYAAIVFKWRGAALTWSICTLTTIPMMLYFGPSFRSVIANLIYFVMPLLAVLGLSIELNWRSKERKALAERDAERQNYMSRLFKAQENERHRLALELHDDATQTLMVIANLARSLGSSENLKEFPQSKEKAERIREMAIKVSEELRRISLDLRPSILDNLGLVPALRWLVTNLSQDGINVRFDFNGEVRNLSSEVDINIFRIVQEALNNIRRHSQATEVQVKLEFFHDIIKLSIRDNGIGFALPKTISGLTAKGKLGLTGIEQRVKFLNGVFAIDSEPAKGTKIFIELKA